MLHEALLKAAPDAILRIDRTGKILSFLGKAEAVFGYTAEEVEGGPVEVLMPETHARQHQSYIETYLETGERKLPDFGRRLQARRRDGKLIPVEISLNQMGEGESVQFVAIVRDVTRRVKDEARLQQLQTMKEAVGLQNALAETAATLAHELNQPLTAVANYADAIEIKLEQSDAGDKEALTMLARKTGDQARLCGDIVKHISQTLSRSVFQPEMTSIHDTVRQFASTVEGQLSAQDVEFVITHEGHDIPVQIDRAQIYQVLGNLVTNALEALSDADIKQIKIISLVTDTHIELSVSDTGKGVPDDRKQAIFESFITDSLIGLGLGLSVAKRLAHAHSGKVWVEDNPGGGAVFKLSLPIA